MWMGAPISLSDWWFWNQLPVTLGNFVGGLPFVGLPMLGLRNAQPATAKGTVAREPHSDTLPQPVEV